MIYNKMKICPIIYKINNKKKQRKNKKKWIQNNQTEYNLKQVQVNLRYRNMIIIDNI